MGVFATAARGNHGSRQGSEGGPSSAYLEVLSPSEEPAVLRVPLPRTFLPRGLSFLPEGAIRWVKGR